MRPAPDAGDGPCGGLGRIENSDFVIDQYRAAAIALGYRGDSIVNSVGDTLACLLGFALAAWLPVRASIPLATAMGLLAGWVMLNNLT